MALKQKDAGINLLRAVENFFLPHGHQELALLLFIFDELSDTIGRFEQRP
jgi:hypothetical protein